MPVPEQIPYVGYIANGQTTEFPITFDLHDPEFLIVTLNKEIPIVGAYTIDMNAKKVVFATAPNDNDQVELYRETELNRDTDYKSYDNSFRPEAVNYDLDTIVRILQEQHMIDSKIAARIKGEIEWRRTHDANFDELSKMRDAQIFSGLKQYLDTILAMTNPNIYDGIGAGIVFALDKKSVQTHLETIYGMLESNHNDFESAINVEKTRALAAEAILLQKIQNEAARATTAEANLQLQISTSVNGIKYFETESALNAFIPSETDPKQAYVFATKKNYLWNGTIWRDEGLSELDQAKKYVNEVNKIPDGFDNTAVYKSNGKVTFGASSDFFYKKLKVKKDEKYLIRSMDYNISKVWYLADDSLNVISESAGTPTVSDEIVTISEDGTLYVNGLYVHALQFKFDVVTGYESKTIELSGDYPKQYYIAYIPDPADPTKIKRVTSTSVVSTVVENVRENDLFKIDAKKISNVKSYYFVADSGVIVSQEGSNEPNLKVIKVPAYASKLIVCSDVAYTNFSILKADYFGNLAYEESIKPDPVVKKNLKDFYPQQPNYRHLLQQKCPKFYNKLRNKTGDVTVCITGTSLTQGNLYTTTRADATTRPPLLHTNDLSSHVFDVLIGYWQGQQYRRYDHTDLTYSSSDWSIKNRLIESDIDIWDDFDFKKNGLTKTTVSVNASVSAVIPVGAWQFNFIYRSDSQSGNCTVSIAEGNSKVEVFNGTNWVEANSFVFSMLESAVTETKGNTCYQKRLKMRCKNKASGGIDSLATAKNITISKGNNSNRFNVVGFEWSPREYMLTFINAARGSHAWGLTGSPENLENYQDSDIWEFKPDLILCEVTSINWGAGFGQALKTDPNYYVNIAKKAYFDDLGMFPNSIYQKSDHYTKCEIIFYGDTVATSVDYDTLWDANKQPKFGLVDVPAWNGSGSTENVGRVKTIFENYEAVEIYVASKPYIFIPVTQQFKQLAYDAFSNYPDAFAPTLADGDSLSFDRVHLNNNGAAFYAYLIKPLFENL